MEGGSIVDCQERLLGSAGWLYVCNLCLGNNGCPQDLGGRQRRENVWERLPTAKLVREH